MLNFHKEEKTIIEILFNDQVPSKVNFQNFNFDKFVKICSSHLLLPLIYSKLKEKKLLKSIPLNLKTYLNEIYNINYERNKNLIKEVLVIIDLLDKNKIDYVLLKGSAHVLTNVYNNIGDRMIGDIDILVDKKKGAETVLLLKNLGYYNLTDDIFFDFRHLNRLINKKKIFAVEIHTRLFDKHKNIIDINDIEKINNVTVFKRKTSADYNIYNDQINDFGYLKNNYSYRSIYDFLILSEKKYPQRKNKIKLDKFKKRYFTIGKELGIRFFRNYNFETDYFSSIRFRISKKIKIYKKMERLIINIVQIIVNLPKKITKLQDKKYRIYLFKKIKSQ